MNPSNKPAWEDWQLTAYVLGEVDHITAAQIEAAAASDAQLARQLAEIRQTLQQISQALQAESQGEAALFEMVAAPPAPAIQPATAQPTAIRRWRLMGLLATSASLLLAVWFASQFSEVREPEQLALAFEEASENPFTASATNAEAQGNVKTTAAWPENAVDAFAEGATFGPDLSKAPARAYKNTMAVPLSGAAGYGGEYAGGAGGGYGGMMGGGMGMGPGGRVPTPQSTGDMQKIAEYAPATVAPQPRSQPTLAQVGTPATGLVTRLARGEGGYGATDGQAPFSHNGSRMGNRNLYGSREQYQSLPENQFTDVRSEPLSTFSIDVDSASYTKCRQLLLTQNRRPPPAAVRIEEFINYFDYEYAGPVDDGPFAAHLAVAQCPWQPTHKLVRIALQAQKVNLPERPAANVVFLLDVSGSMNEANKLPLVKESMRMLAEQLDEKDRVAIVVYAGAAGCVLEGTSGDQQQQILAAIDNLQAGGSTNGGQGIQLAYQLARDSFVAGGINRVVLCTDGDFNVGVTSTEALVELVVENAQSNIFLTVLGFGAGNTNDAMMEQISNRGNGVYAFVDSRREAHRQMVEQLAGNLITVAKDVKIQVEFNPAFVQSYRLIGYENRVMAAADFNNDRKDAGEIGAGHRVTALYEITPVGNATNPDTPQVDALRYQPKPQPEPQSKPESKPEPEPQATNESTSDSNRVEIPAELAEELLAVKLRYKQPEGATSQLVTFPLKDSQQAFTETDRDFQWAATVAQFGMLLRGSQHAGQSTWESLLEQAIAVAGVSPDASRQECLEMIRKCQPTTYLP